VGSEVFNGFGSSFPPNKETEVKRTIKTERTEVINWEARILSS